MRISLLYRRGLDGYYLLHFARADLLRRLGRTDEEAAAYERALERAPIEVERDFLRGRCQPSATEPGAVRSSASQPTS